MERLNLKLNKILLTIILISTTSLVLAEQQEEVIKTNNTTTTLVKSYSINTSKDADSKVPSDIEIKLIEEFQTNGFNNNENILPIIEQGVEVSDPKITSIYASLYANGILVEKNEKQAIKYYNKAKNLGDDEAALSLGTLLLKNGEEVEAEHNYKYFYQKHPEKKVQYIIGKDYYKYGYYHEAEEWLTKSANAGSDRSQLLLYKVYSDENNKYGNQKKAIFWLVKSADNGNVESITELLKIVVDNKLEVKNKAKVISILEDLLQDENEVTRSEVIKVRNNQKSLMDVLGLPRD